VNRSIAVFSLAVVGQLCRADISASYGWGVNLSSVPNYFSTEGVIQESVNGGWRTQPVLLLHGHSRRSGPLAVTAGVGFGSRPTWIVGGSALLGRRNDAIVTFGAAWGTQDVLTAGYSVGGHYGPGAYSQRYGVRPFVAVTYRLG